MRNSKGSAALWGLDRVVGSRRVQLSVVNDAFDGGDGQPLWCRGNGPAEYLLAIEDLQEFARSVAAFLTDFDLWLTPTLSAPLPAIGEMTATDDEPLRALARGGET